MDNSNLRKILAEQQANITQRYAISQKKQQEAEEEEISLDEWVGVDSSDGRGIIKNSNGTTKKGEIVTNGQILPGQRVLNLTGNSSTLNSMPTAWRNPPSRRYYPRIETGKIAILVEVIYDAAEPIPCSCVFATRTPIVYIETATFTPIVYGEDIKFSPIAYESPLIADGETRILFATFEDKEEFPEESCDCNLWFPATDSNGTVRCYPSNCSQEGGFATEQDCLNFAGSFPPVGSGYYTAQRNLSDVSVDFMAGNPLNSTVGIEYFWFPDIYVIKGKAGQKIVDYNPDYQNDLNGRFFTENGDPLTWNEVDIFTINGYLEYRRNGNNWIAMLLGYLGSAHSFDNPTAKNPWPISQSQIKVLWNSENIALTNGWVVWRNDLSLQNPDGSIPSGWQRYAIFFREYGYYQGSYSYNETVNNNPPYFPNWYPFYSEFPRSNTQLTDSQGNTIETTPYHLATIWLAGNREEPVRIWEGLAQKVISQWQEGGYKLAHSFTALKFVMAYLSCPNEETTVVVVKYGLKKAFRVNNNNPLYRHDFWLEWCHIKVVILEGDSIVSSKIYENAEEVYIPPECPYAPLYKQWQLIPPVSGNTPVNSTNYTENNSFDLKLLENIPKAQYLNQYFDFVYPYYSSYFDSGQLHQGFEIPVPNSYPLSIPKMGCNFFEKDGELWAAFLKLDEWIAESGKILADLFKDNPAEVLGTIIMGKIHSEYDFNVANNQDFAYINQSSCWLDNASAKAIKTKIKIKIPTEAGEPFLLEACPYPKASAFSSAGEAIPVNILEREFGDVGDGELFSRGIYTWAENNLLSGQQTSASVGFPVSKQITIYRDQRYWAGWMADSLAISFLGCNGVTGVLNASPNTQALRWKPKIIGKCE